VELVEDLERRRKKGKENKGREKEVNRIEHTMPIARAILQALINFPRTKISIFNILH